MVNVKSIFSKEKATFPNQAPIFGSTPESWAMKRAATALTQKIKQRDEND